MRITDLIGTRATAPITVSQKTEYAVDALQELAPYTVTKNILGEKTYVFSPAFILDLTNSFSSNVQQGMNRAEQMLFDEYIAFVQYNIIGRNHEIIIQLDNYLGGL